MNLTEDHRVIGNLRHSTSTRRRFLAGTALSATAATGLTPPSSAVAASAPLSRDRLETFAALVSTVAAVPGTCADARSAREAARALDAHYRGAAPRLRSHIDRTLESLDDVPGRRFAALPLGPRLERLVAALDDSRGSALSARDVRDAVALVVAACSGRFGLDATAADVWTRVARARGARIAA